MKRITFWPQAVLGLAFSWGALTGWAAAEGSLSATPALLYFGAVAWVIGYDTIYACQDMEDDAVVGVRSTALLFGRATRLCVALFYAATVTLIGAALALAGAGPAAFAGLVGFGLHLGWQALRLDVADGARCLALFRSNRDAGAILFAGLLLAGVA